MAGARTRARAGARTRAILLLVWGAIAGALRFPIALARVGEAGEGAHRILVVERYHHGALLRFVLTALGALCMVSTRALHRHYLPCSERSQTAAWAWRQGV